MKGVEEVGAMMGRKLVGIRIGQGGRLLGVISI